MRRRGRSSYDHRFSRLLHTACKIAQRNQVGPHHHRCTTLPTELMDQPGLQAVQNHSILTSLLDQCCLLRKDAAKGCMRLGAQHGVEQPVLQKTTE